MTGDLTENLGRVFGIYVVGFILFVAAMAGLESLGVAERTILWCFLGFTVLVYAVIGVMSRTNLISEYYVAGRTVPPVYNGMATGADWMSGASFVGMAGTLFVLGYDGLAFIVGWTGGFVLVAVLIAPYLRKFGAYTVPDFLAARYGGGAARLMGIVVLIACSFTYVTAQIYASGIIASRFLGIPFELAVWAGLFGILVCSFLGGMRAVTWTQVAQYIILIIAYLLPAVIMSAWTTGVPIPQLTYFGVLEEVSAMEAAIASAAGTPAPFGADSAGAAIGPHMAPFEPGSERGLHFAMLVFCLMVGTASLPHVLMRFFTTPSVRDARGSVAWSLFFIFLLYVTAPAYAAFAKLNVYELFASAEGRMLAFADIPDWMLRWGAIEGHTLVKLCGENAVSLEAVRAACAAKGLTEGVPLGELQLNRDMIVLATPEIAGMPIWVLGLVGAGGFAAALSTADGLLLAIANALSHDIYFRTLDKKASPQTRLLVAKTLLVVVAVGAALTARTKPADILSMVAWAFSIAGSGLFAALTLGVWWRRATSAGAVAGMAVGFSVAVFYLVGSVYGVDLVKGSGDEISWFGVPSISAGVFGVPAAFLTTIIVSMITPEPSREMQDFVDGLRVPRGDALSDA